MVAAAGLGPQTNQQLLASNLCLLPRKTKNTGKRTWSPAPRQPCSSPNPNGVLFKPRVVPSAGLPWGMLPLSVRKSAHGWRSIWLGRVQELRSGSRRNEQAAAYPKSEPSIAAPPLGTYPCLLFKPI